MSRAAQLIVLVLVLSSAAATVWVWTIPRKHKFMVCRHKDNVSVCWDEWREPEK